MILLFDFRQRPDLQDNRPETPEDLPKEKLGFKDLLALVIAQYVIILPMTFIAVIIAILVMLFITKVWLR